jgi:hypothetical protein
MLKILKFHFLVKNINTIFYLVITISSFFLFSFCDFKKSENNREIIKNLPKKINEIPLPKNFERIKTSKNSFGNYLQNLSLRNENIVYLHNGNKKDNQDAQFAVIDINIGKKNLVQCADAVMLLRAEYLFAQKRFEEIKFHFSNGFLCEYSKWQQGYRIQVQGNNVSWVKKTTLDISYEAFKKYLEIIYSYAGTLSLPKDNQPQNLEKLQIGDIFLKSGSPGHAVIVVDMAQNPISKQKIFLLAQSYMPAQDIHILKNPENQKLSPWYDTKINTNQLITPEWNFDKNAVRKF